MESFYLNIFPTLRAGKEDLEVAFDFVDRRFKNFQNVERFVLAFVCGVSMRVLACVRAVLAWRIPRKRPESAAYVGQVLCAGSDGAGQRQGHGKTSTKYFL